MKEAYERASGNPARLGFAEKRRSQGIVSGDLVAGDIQGAAVFIVDDMISTGGTMLRAADACKQRGAREIYALAAHGLFHKGVEAMLASPVIDRTIVTDSVAPFPLTDETLRSSVDVVATGSLFAKTISRLNGGGSIADLLGDSD